MWARLLAVAALALPLAAQSTQADLSGAILDPDGLPVGGASIRAVQTATNTEAATVSAEDGSYHFPVLPAGPYTLTVTRDGFTTLRREGLAFSAGDQIRLDLTLRPGAAAQSIQVTGEAPLLKTARGTVSFTADRKKIVTLPLNGRNFVPLVALSPGVSLPPDSTLPRFNGSRPRTSEYIYDGISVLQPEPGQVAFFPVIDAIDELRVETNSYSAQYGRSNGGVIMVNQKSGTNELHGTLFEFFRNEKLNARNLFATTGAKPRFRRNQYGFVLGGPIQRDKTFFFADWQGTRLDTGVVRTSTVPTMAQKSGVFTAPVTDPLSGNPFPGNTIPLTRFDPVALAALARYPDPTNTSAANNYTRTGSNTTAQDQWDLRLDRYFGTTHRVFARYAWVRDHSSPFRPLPDGSGNITSGILGDTLTRADSLATEDSWTLGPTAVNQFRFGYTGRRFHRNSVNTPIYDIAGYQQLGPPPSGTGKFSTSVTQFVDNFSWLRGSHSLKLGADIRLEHLDVLEPALPTGSYQFNDVFTGNSFASFLLGQVTRYSVDSQPETLRPRAKIAEFFIQDDWRATRRLSVNAGLRYTLNFPSTVVGDKFAVFNLNTRQLDFPHTARNLDKTNFGPRLGLAYKVTDSFVIRSGYGLTWIEMAGITTPFTTPLFPFVQSLTQQSLDNVHPAFLLRNGPTVQPRPIGPDAGLGQGVFATQRDNGSGYAQQWNLGLQKTMGKNWSVEVGYLGSKLTRLGVPDINLNQLNVEQLSLGPALTQQVDGVPLAQRLKPYPNFTAVTLYRNNIGHSTYHSLQARVEKRLSAGLTFNLAYTFSRLIDDAGAVFNAAILTGPVMNYNAADSHNKRLEKDVSTGNIPHVFSAGFVYDPPFAHGWEISGILRLQSGSPIAVTQATNYNAFAGFGIQRPNRVADPQLPAGQRSTGAWFNTAAFTPAPQFTLGNSSRNPVSGPPYRTLDVMVGKTFGLTERYSVEFRAEAFNVTNTPSLGNPNGSFGSPGFGSITTANDPRVFEGAVKLHF